MPDATPGGPPLAGHHIVFTGELSSLDLTEAYALVQRLGGTAAADVTPRTTMLVVGRAEPPGSTRDARDAGDQSVKIRQAEEINGRGRGRIDICTEDRFCELAGLRSQETLRQQYYPLRDVMGMYPRIRDSQLRCLQRFGLIHPIVQSGTERFVSFSDLILIRQASAELEQGVPFRAVLRSLEASQSGQLAFNFRLDPAPAKILHLRRLEPNGAARAASVPSVPGVGAGPATAAEDYFLQGSALDQGDEESQSAAAAAYRRALELDPYLVAAVINLANVHYARDELPEAQALYERAIRLEPGFFEAHFNLGNIHHDLGCFHEAASCYREALALHSAYPDAHFYLAVTLEKLGHSQEARPHWLSYQQLAPDGDWVDLAREFSE